MDRVIYVKLREFLAAFIMAFITRLLRVLWDLGLARALAPRRRYRFGKSWPQSLMTGTVEGLPLGEPTWSMA